MALDCRPSTARVWIESVDGTTTPYTLVTKNLIRYQGADSSVEYVSSGHGGDLPGGGGHEAGGFRFVGGRSWAREGRGPWKRFSPAAGAKVSERDTFAGQLAAAAALAAFVRSAPEVTGAPGDGATTYRAAVEATEIPGLLGSIWGDAGGRVQLEVVVRDGGAVHRFTMTGGGRTLDVTYDDLGADQSITAP